MWLLGSGEENHPDLAPGVRGGGPAVVNYFQIGFSLLRNKHSRLIVVLIARSLQDKTGSPQ